MFSEQHFGLGRQRGEVDRRGSGVLGRNSPADAATNAMSDFIWQSNSLFAGLSHQQFPLGYPWHSSRSSSLELKNDTVSVAMQEDFLPYSNASSRLN